jgi:hypothetical protein
LAGRSRADMRNSTKSTSREAREELARQQAQLVRAIQLGEPAPAGIDASKLRTTQESLTQKRLRSVQKSWPGIAGTLGEQFQGQFQTYGALDPTPADAGIDGYEFAKWLKSKGQLSHRGRIELTRWEVSHGAIPRLVWLRDARSLILVYRWRRITRELQVRLPSVG